MKWKVAAVMGLSVLIVPCIASAQFGSGIVLDPTNLIQNSITALNSVKTALTTAAMYEQQAKQLTNEYNQIRIAIDQYKSMVQNLQRMPEGLGVVQTVLAYGNKLTGLLNAAQGLSYNLDRSTKEFQDLYVEAETVSTGDLHLVRDRFLKARMQASATAVQVQSIQSNMSDVFQRLCNLLNGVDQSQGNLDSLQLAAQQQALTLTTLQQIQALQATSDRLKAQKEAEEVALAQIRQRVLDELITAPPDYTGAAGVLPTWRWTDTP